MGNHDPYSDCDLILFVVATVVKGPKAVFDLVAPKQE